jgi:lysozyme family protein
MVDPFTAAVQFVLADEGALTDDPHNDPDGGLTNFGISQKQNPDVDVATLTRDQAVAVYQRRYWAPAGCDRLPWPLSFLMFDCAVNQGVGTAARLLQGALGVTPDGVIGPATLAAVTKRDPWELTARMTAIRLQAYVSDAEYRANGQGWFYRVARNLLAAGRAA